ncbi:MAG TPA: hypothetical protein VGO64_05960, partial [Candidatus Limnocylindrales bacterium]|nr:hypothetical protein [Candidatus Limnocylindrales bacterium]
MAEREGGDRVEADDEDRGPSMDLLGILLVIIVVAAGLRVYQLDRNPPELFEDELSGLVSIESVATTGHDVEETNLPFLTTRLELKQPLYFVATLPFQAVLGETTMAARLPAMLFGVVGVLLVIAVAVVLGMGTTVALIAGGLQAITPWAIHFARAGWEPAALLPFTLGGIALLWTGLRDGRRPRIVGAAAVFAIGAYAYHPALLVHVVMAAAIVAVRWRDLLRGNARGSLAIGTLVAAMLLVPYAIASTDPLFLERTRAISVLRFGWPQALVQAWQNYWAQWDPSFLFGGRATNPRINPGPLLFAWTIPFIVVGLDRILHRRSTADLFLLLWLILGPLPAALTEDGTTPHAARGLVALPAIVIVTAIGLARVFDLASTSRRGRVLAPMVAGVTAAIAIGAATTWASDYFDRYPIRSANWWGYGTSEAFAIVRDDVPAGATLCIATGDISRFTFPHQVALYLPRPAFTVVEGIHDPVCQQDGTYLLALVSRALDQPVRTIDAVADINGKPFFELD